MPESIEKHGPKQGLSARIRWRFPRSPAQRSPRFPSRTPLPEPKERRPGASNVQRIRALTNSKPTRCAFLPFSPSREPHHAPFLRFLLRVYRAFVPKLRSIGRRPFRLVTPRNRSGTPPHEESPRLGALRTPKGGMEHLPTGTSPSQGESSTEREGLEHPLPWSLRRTGSSTMFASTRDKNGASTYRGCSSPSEGRDRVLGDRENPKHGESVST